MYGGGIEGGLGRELALDPTHATRTGPGSSAGPCSTHRPVLIRSCLHSLNTLHDTLLETPKHIWPTFGSAVRWMKRSIVFKRTTSSRIRLVYHVLPFFVISISRSKADLYFLDPGLGRGVPIRLGSPLSLIPSARSSLASRAGLGTEQTQHKMI